MLARLILAILDAKVVSNVRSLSKIEFRFSAVEL